MRTKIENILSFVKGKQHQVDQYDPKTGTLTLIGNDGSVQVIPDVPAKYADMLISLKDD